MAPEETHGEFGERVARNGVRGFSGARLRRYRDGLDLTIDDLADAAGVSPQAISSWETARSAPTPHLLSRVARTLHVTVADLVPIPQGRWRLHDLRVHAGLTQADAANALAMSPTQLARFEKGRKEFSETVAHAMTVLYGVSDSVLKTTWDRTVQDREHTTTRIRES